MYRSVTSSVLSSDRPSQYSEQLLTRLGLRERFEKDPELVLAALRGPGEGLSREYLFVLSELSFYHAVQSQKPEYFLASAVYAWAFVLGLLLFVGLRGLPLGASRRALRLMRHCLRTL